VFDSVAFPVGTASSGCPVGRRVESRNCKRELCSCNTVHSDGALLSVGTGYELCHRVERRKVGVVEQNLHRPRVAVAAGPLSKVQRHHEVEPLLDQSGGHGFSEL
jgi:hypothetical protein